MSRLNFQIEGVRALCAHALAAPAHDLGYGDPTAPHPQLVFVKHDGIYLMSNGKPPLMTSPSVVYAENYNLTTRDRSAVYDAAAVGGDDFAEYPDFVPHVSATARKSSKPHHCALPAGSYMGGSRTSARAGRATCEIHAANLWAGAD